MAKLRRLMFLLGVLVVLLTATNCKPTTSRDYVESIDEEEEGVLDDLHSFLPVRDSTEEESVESQSKEDLCATIYCGNGKECVLEAGRPVCTCAMACPDHYHPICGTDGVTYGNPCELHRAACLQNIRIRKHMQGHCEAPPPPMEPPTEKEDKPLVCYEIERDQLRQLLIDWMKGRVENEVKDLDVSEISYARVLTENFRECDQDGDDQLDSREFMECVEKNETVAAFSGNRPEEGHVLRGLCVDALILMSDTNEDWMLDLEEFLRCMDPNYEPPKKQCSLENELYEDGAETRVDCNICVCACGNWVCSAMSCEGIEDYDLFEPYDVEQGPLPSREERYALLRGFIAAEHVNLRKIDEEVPPPSVPQGGHYPGFPNPGAHHGHDQFSPEFPYDMPSDLAPAVGLDEEDTEDTWPYPETEEELSEEEEEEEEEELRSNATPLDDDEEDPEGGMAFDDYIRSVHKTYDHQGQLPSEDEVKSMACCKDHGKEGHVHNHDQVTTEQTREHPETRDHGNNQHHTENEQTQGNREPAEAKESSEELASTEVETPTPDRPQVITEIREVNPAPVASEEEYVPPRPIIPVVSFNITVAEHRIIHTGEGQEEREGTEHHHTNQNENTGNLNNHSHHNNRIHNGHHHKHNNHHSHQGQGHEASHQGDHHVAS